MTRTKDSRYQTKYSSFQYANIAVIIPLFIKFASLKKKITKTVKYNIVN